MNTTKTALKTEGFVFGSLLVLPTAIAFLMWLADGSQRVGFADAHVFSVRYISAVLVLMLLLVPIFVMAERRAPDAPLTWGEAMAAAVYVFFVLFWLYGVVPHEFLNWADSELQWRPDKKIFGSDPSAIGAGWSTWWSGWNKIPITVDKQKVRDIVAVLIYGVGLGGLIWAFSFWNNRAKNIAAAAAETPTSTYGRPLVAKAGS